MKIEKYMKKKFAEYKLHIYLIFSEKDFRSVIKIYPEAKKLCKDFHFSWRESKSITFNPINDATKYIFFLGMGIKTDYDFIRKAAKQSVEEAKRIRSENFVIHFISTFSSIEDKIENFIDFLYLNLYSFDKYKSDDKNVKIKKIAIDIDFFDKIEDIIKKGAIIDDIVSGIRNIVNETPTVVTPDYIVKLSGKTAKESDRIDITVIKKKELEKLSMNGILSVGKSSPFDPALIKLEYNPANYKKTVSLVGKGITFDSGGLNIKTGGYMKTMKSDMAGAATVLGIVQLIARLELNVKLIAYIPVAENMPGGSSYKPDDILIFNNGKSVEIVNTDAEGRLILADALIQSSKDDPDVIIEFSTLTGSIVSALGESFSGLMCNNKKLLTDLLKAAEVTGERLWEMPLFEDYRKSIKSDIADLKNSDYGYASSIKAALFLTEFVDNKPFAHIDFAGGAFINKTNEYYSLKGATGIGIRLVLHYLKILINN